MVAAILLVAETAVAARLAQQPDRVRRDSLVPTPVVSVVAAVVVVVQASSRPLLERTSETRCHQQPRRDRRGSEQ